MLRIQNHLHARKHKAMMKAKPNIILAILLAACASHLVLAHSPFDTRDGLPAALPLPQPLLQRIGKRGNDNTTGLRYYNQNTSRQPAPIPIPISTTQLSC